MSAKILTVDDNKTIRFIIGRAFKKFDCKVFEASNGSEGLAVAAKVKPDVIILDYTMPIMDGNEMLVNLRADPLLKAIPVVMLTAETGKDTVLKIAKLGVRDYIIKPFNEDIIVKKINRIVQIHPRTGSDTATIAASNMGSNIQVLVVDEKPAILEQIQSVLSDLGCVVEGKTQSHQIITNCRQNQPSAVLVSLTLPDNEVFTIFHSLRSDPATKSIPVFGTCINPSTAEAIQAQQSGFNGILTKPIDFRELKSSFERVLDIDLTGNLFVQQEGALVLKISSSLDQHMSDHITVALKPQLAKAVESGVEMLLLDLSQIKIVDSNLVNLVSSAIKTCQKFSIKYHVLGCSDATAKFRQVDKTKSWPFVSSVDEALSPLKRVGTAD